MKVTVQIHKAATIYTVSEDPEQAAREACDKFWDEQVRPWDVKVTHIFIENA